MESLRRLGGSPVGNHQLGVEATANLIGDPTDFDSMSDLDCGRVAIDMEQLGGVVAGSSRSIAVASQPPGWITRLERGTKVSVVISPSRCVLTRSSRRAAPS